MTAAKTPIDQRPAETTAATGDQWVIGHGHQRAVLTEVGGCYDRWLVGGLAALAEELEGRNGLRGRRVRVDGRAGRAGAIVPDGRLTVVLDSGESVLVGSGEVEVTAADAV
jgi:biotin-(acetyl-CoA carboxylase) ligase